MSFASKAPVIVAGAGPVGSTFALYLARNGIPVTLLEKCATLPEDLRASTFHPPTLDMLERLDLTSQLIRMGLIVRKYQYRDRRSGDIAEFDMSLIAGETAHPYRLQCEQWRLNRLCVAELQKHLHAQVLFSHEVTGATQDNEGVQVQVNTPDGPRTLQGSFVYGCDGARSSVRKSMGIAFDGFTWPDKFLVASTAFPLEQLLPRLAGVNYVADTEEWCVILRCGDWWRVLFPTKPEDSDEQVLRDAYLEARLQNLAPKPGQYEIAHKVLYHVHQRVAETYRQGRILIGGDAAHINNPVGGMGMNGGIHDAFNLAEKMVALWQGAADDSILDVYDRQRRLTAQKFVQDQSIANKKLLEERDPATRREQQRQVMEVAADPVRSREFLLRTSMIASLRDSYAIQ